MGSRVFFEEIFGDGPHGTNNESVRAWMMILCIRKKSSSIYRGSDPRSDPRCAPTLGLRLSLAFGMVQRMILMILLKIWKQELSLR